MAGFSEVFKRELEEIGKRRSLLGAAPPDAGDSPSASQGLTGLAFSGGGIRSASFCLGVVQSLAAAGILRTVDYLSSVSGGGYTASCLNCLLNDPELGARAYDAERFPLRKDSGTPETAVLSHLRNSSSYLSSGGLIDQLRLATLVLRGILLNLFLFFPIVCVAAFVTGLAYRVNTGEGGRHAPLVFAALLLGGLFLLLVVTYPFVSRLFRGRFNWGRRNGYELLMTFAMALFLSAVFLLPVAFIVDRVLLYPWSTFRFASLLSLDYWPLWIGLAGAGLLLLVAGPMAASSGAAGRVVLYAVGLLGPVAVLCVYLAFCIQWVRIPHLSLGLIDELSLAAERSETQMKTLDASLRPTAALAGELHRRGFVESRSEPVAVKHIAPVRGARDGWRIETRNHVLDVFETADRLSIVPVSGHAQPVPGWPLAVLALVFLALNHFLLDVNITSPHGFYRDRLSRAFLIRRKKGDPAGGLESSDDVKLSALNAEGTAAPYHLINAALNLEGSGRPSVRGRNADFFLFSKHFTGSESTGYCSTADLEAVDSHLNLGTAMAISAGAAAPNMGSTTIRPLMFVMTLLNIRLGYWLPNPRRLAQGMRPGERHYYGHAGAAYVLRESLGLIDDRRRHVNVSDGGHIENLGVYELLRRRSKVIIAVDGEADPQLTFGSLITLIRYAHIDMGIRIEIDLAAIRKGERHHALGTIRYSEEEEGRLLYLKASLTGDENPYVLDYAARQPAFPHESTADQFFNEAQFEAYRALGHHIGKRGGADLLKEAAENVSRARA